MTNNRDADCRTDRLIKDCQTYQLWISVPELLQFQVGRLGPCRFPPGCYIYTGSARRHLAARLARHRSRNKRLHWHIDYLLAANGVVIQQTHTFAAAECAVHRKTPGIVLIPRFGASDCRAGCGSHLNYLGNSFSQAAPLLYG